MTLHANARLSVKGRELLVDRVEKERWSVMEVAEAAGITERTAHRKTTCGGVNAVAAARSVARAR